MFAADLLGEAGNSAEVRLDLQSDACARWIRDVLDALALPEAIIIGNSLGGWMALKFACLFPGHVTKLVLIGASGITPPRSAFIEKAAVFAGKGETDQSQLESVNGVSMPPEVMEFILLIMEHFIPVTDPLPLFTDEELIRLKMPLLFLAGEEDATMEAGKAAERLSALIPGVRTLIVPNCGHVVMNASGYFVPFLTKGCKT